MHAAIDWLCINDADAAILIPEVSMGMGLMQYMDGWEGLMYYIV
jgi:hypothetical protein